MAIVKDNKIYLTPAEIAEKVNISKNMIIELIKKGWFGEEDVIYNKKRVLTYYYLSEEAIEKLKKAYGTR
jgi:predicted DNA-binding protein YlxM (UPF0122 family)